MCDLTVSKENGFTEEMIERFDLVLLFKQIEKMLLRFYEKGNTTQIIFSCQLSQQSRAQLSILLILSFSMFPTNRAFFCIG